ncbi:serine/threonine-protein kinase [Streptomyces sp. H27-C3]|uniref:serine/threonine-protein kinase n=1 Tax=Streptomyces sp. H27-C3 TaxID=3046305 RepID=UPI0024B9A024|nr:serine/threonine-protein kinase [Streptomyces sp. H27-C3]MDJ0465372.1 serine/threonine-protein kinase [Streptomyces sp. H27-C3]
MEPLRDDDPRTIGVYTLVCRLGAGGMGQVYLGESPAGQLVAVKVIKPSVLDEDSRARFLLEVDSLKTVYGPFIASFVAADAHAERPWLAVEFVHGPDLLAHVAEHGSLPLVETASLGALLAEGLGTVHEAGLLHRDLKPQNILLAPTGPKVIDFGLAVLAERRSTLTATGVVVGSVLCMPPEQARGEHDLDRPADVYALGAVLLYAATVHYPYAGSSWQAVALKIEDPAVAPDLSDLPPQLEPLISAMLALDPADRPTLPQVTEQLVGVMAGQGLTAVQAKRRLTALTPEVALPEALELPEDPPGYTPTLVDVAVYEDDEAPPQSGEGAPDADTPSDEAVPPTPEKPGTSSDPARPGVRLSAPLRIAEVLRAAYASDARF